MQGVSVERSDLSEVRQHHNHAIMAKDSVLAQAVLVELIQHDKTITINTFQSVRFVT